MKNESELEPCTTKDMNHVHETVGAFQCLINTSSTETGLLHSDDASKDSQPTAAWEDFLLTVSRNPQAAESPVASSTLSLPFPCKHARQSQTPLETEPSGCHAIGSTLQEA